MPAEVRKKSKCPECGGDMGPAAYGRGKKVCESCGAQFEGLEYDKAWDKVRAEKKTKEQKHRDERQEYLEWYQSKKDSRN